MRRRSKEMRDESWKSIGVMKNGVVRYKESFSSSGGMLLNNVCRGDSPR